jgi:ABC-type transport system involved in cytochrome c biogenesis permease subunit
MGLLLCGMVAAGVGFTAPTSSRAADTPPGNEASAILGKGPAYEMVGKIAVMHEGRVKPLDTLAREEIKQIYGRESAIKLFKPAMRLDGKTRTLDSLSDAEVQKLGPKGSLDVRDLEIFNELVETWGPVGAFLNWSARPEYWDEQPFILVDYLPLRRLILADSIHARLKAIAEKLGALPEAKAAIAKLIDDPQPTAAALKDLLGLPEVAGPNGPANADRMAIAEMALSLGEDHKWLTPNEIAESKITSRGQTLPFTAWFSEAMQRKRSFDSNPLSTDRPTEEEKRGIEAGTRLFHYQAFRDRSLARVEPLLVMPRPTNSKFLEYTTKAIDKARETRDMNGLAKLQLDALKALDTYWNDTPREDRHDPGKNKVFDEKYTTWLRENSTWVPLVVLLDAKPEELAAAGFPEKETTAFLTAFRDFEAAEDIYPGKVNPAVAQTLFDASRALGTAINPEKYPTLAMMERETQFNEFSPFWKAPYAYGTALFLLAISLGFTGVAQNSLMGKAGRGIYLAGMAGLLAGIILEVYGFYLRVLISGWAPVTNMYETVIWVALVTAVLAFVFEMIFRRGYAGVAGSGVALLGTLAAANVPLLDPSIKSLVPVLRSNYWLTIHVLTEVSSYAAFGLAWGLGLIAVLYYLTATYRRSPSFTELALPLVPGLPLLSVGVVGLAASYGAFGDKWLTGNPLFYTFATMAGLGGMASLGVVWALLGEAVSRTFYRWHLRRSGVVDPAEFPFGPPQTADFGPSHDHEHHPAHKPTVDEIRAIEAAPKPQLDARSQMMQETAAKIKPLSTFIYRSMQVGVLLIAAGTILGGVWADYSWGRFWGWDPKEVWALITLLVYLVPLHGRFAGWVNTFGLVIASVVCFLSVIMAWYGVNFVLGVGLHSYGFVEAGYQGAMSIILAGIMSFPIGAYWRRKLTYLAA